MSLRVLLSAVALSLLPVIATPAIASPVTYNYTGAFYDVPNPNQTRDRLTGFITVDAPLTPGAHQITKPINFFFSDSFSTYTPATVAVSPFLFLDIAPSGAVDNWNLNVLGLALAGQVANNFTSDPSGDVVFTGAARPEVSTVAGRWTESPLAPALEPSTLALTGLGMLIIVATGRRRYALR